MRSVVCMAVLCLLTLPGCWSLSTLGEGEAKPAELAEGDEVTVVEVVKGDEIVVKKGEGTATVRILGVHCFDEVIDDPQMARFRDAAREYLVASVLRKSATISLATPPKDSHGRYLAYVTAGTKEAAQDVGASLIYEGLGTVYTEYGFERESAYLSLEAEARRAGKGLWGLAASSKLVVGLRDQWAAFRKKRDGGAPPDPLLAVQAANESAPVATP